MDKPKKKSKEYYDYAECCKYLEDKYGYDERNYANKKWGVDDETPDLDFWHWVCDNLGNVHNGCFITFTTEQLEELIKPEDAWIREIYGHYIEEFADENGELLMYAWW